MEPVLKVKDGELLYKIIRMKKAKEGVFHKIISKKNLAGKIEGASILEKEEGKDVDTFTAENGQEFDSEVAKYISQVKPDGLEINDFIGLYEVIDFSDVETQEEQIERIRENPDRFSQWDTTSESPRKLKVDNPFLLDDEE